MTSLSVGRPIDDKCFLEVSSGLKANLSSALVVLSPTVVTSSFIGVVVRLSFTVDILSCWILAEVDTSESNLVSMVVEGIPLSDVITSCLMVVT